MRKDTKNFLRSSQYDLETANFMLNTGRYIYVIFMCHLSLEKILKALISETKQIVPPKTHNLIYLIKIGNISLPKEYFEFIAKINNANIITRYPEDFTRVLEAYPESIAKEYLSITKEIHQWLKQNKKLAE
jgi:HEPN domain-containing protein